MQRLEVSGAVRLIYRSLGVKYMKYIYIKYIYNIYLYKYNIYLYKMQRLEVSGAVRLIYRSLGVKGLRKEQGNSSSSPVGRHGLL